MLRRPTKLVLLLALLTVLVRPAHADGEKIESIEIEGRLVDDKAKLLRFLGLSPGGSFGQKAQQQMADDLAKQLGYRLVSYTADQGQTGIRLKIVVEPMRVVRSVRVHGNWPLFDDEIIRHLQLRTGSRLPPDEELGAFLRGEADKVQKFLERDGYFNSTVKLIPRKGPREEWIDLDVEIQLGDWYRLETVLPEGNTAISRLELQDAFDHCCFRWGRFGVQRMRDDAHTAEKTLHERGYPAARVIPDFNFELNANPATRKIKLPIKVVEKRKVDVKFVGNRSVGDRELREELTLFSAGAYDDIELAESARALQRHYQKYGFFETKVTYQRRRIDQLTEEVTFIVVEGPVLKVRSVDFQSETGDPLRFTNEELRTRAKIETRVFPRLGLVGLGEGGYVTSRQLEQDGERLVEFYKSRGFPVAKVRPEVARDPVSFGALGALGAETAGGLDGKDDLYVRFYVDEGRQELVDRVEIEFSGDHKKSERDITRAMKLTAGAPYTAEALHDDQQRIGELYKPSGRPYVIATFQESTWNAAHDRIVLHCIISEGPDVVFGEILIRGNFKTFDRTILMDLPFKPGDRYDQDKLDAGERNLQTHLIFSSARVVPIGLRDGRNPVPIVVTVQERYLEKAGSLAVAAGIATDKLPNYVYVSAGWIWNNFFGFGSQLELRGDFGFSTQSYGASARYTDVRAFGPGWRLDLTGFVRNELTVRFGPLFTFGLSSALTRNLTPALRMYLKYDNYQAQVSVPFTRLDGPHDQTTVRDDTHTAKFSVGLVWDRRVGNDGNPNPLMPVKGWMLAASFGWAFPSSHNDGWTNFWSSDNNFLIAAGQAIGFLPFKIRGAQFTLIGNLRYDEGIPIGTSALPVVERFFGGGDTTTRGYDPDTLKTEIIRSDVGPLQGAGFRVIPQGGNIRLLSTVEVQFPIAKTFLGLPWQWVGALFYDLGAIADSPELIRGSDFKHAIGLSVLRILTPVGPLSLEYAYPLTQTLAEERWKTNPWYSHFPGRIHFNWGIPLSRL